MKVSRSTIKLLSSFRTISPNFILTPPSRFFIFGQGKDYEFSSLVVEGTIRERISEPIVFNFPQPKDNELNVSEDKHADPERKVSFFNQLMNNAKEVASFTIDEKTTTDIGKLGRSKPTHIRLWKSSDYVLARPFDARRYFDNIIEEERNKYDLFHLSNLKGDTFTVYIEYPVFKRLLKDTYDVSVLDNGLLIFDGVETGLTYYMRDQRLGANWADEVQDTIGEETVLMLDPKVVQQLHRNMKSDN